MASRSFAVALALFVGVACSSSGTDERKSSDKTEPAPGGSTSTGSGPCKTAGQACDDCINAAVPVCNEGPCKEEDLELQNCSVMAVYYPCESATGDPSIDCCKIAETVLIDCWNQKCPEMQACM